VNESQRIELKSTLWKLFSQKQQDYVQKINELNGFVDKFNSDQNKFERVVGLASNVGSGQQNNYHNENEARWPREINRKNSSEKYEKHRNVSLQRKPL
jgi:hypothetical protein